MPIFAFTDIEGSTGLWEKHPQDMGAVIARHYEILDRTVEAWGGKIIKKTGDGIFALFEDEGGTEPSRSLNWAIALQREFQDERWPVIQELRVRVALHSGHAEEMAGDYYGPTANRTARLMALGWGGQIVVSEDLAKAAVLPEGAALVDHGFHQVKDLPEPQRVFGLTHPGLKLNEFPALKSLSSKPHNLPQSVSPYVGHQRELAQISALIKGPHSRLITLLGGGGMGKTRLAIHAARGHLDDFKHGVNRVDLNLLDTPDQLAELILSSLKLTLYRQKSARQQLLDYVSDKNMLLILDPGDRLAEGVTLIYDLLETCPGLRVMVCSRRRMHLRGEAMVEVKGMDYPSQAVGEGFSSSGAARIFTQEAQRHTPHYAIRADDREAFLRICRALRGMPLGLELAAENLRGQSMAALAEKVEKDPRTLSGARHDLPPWHRTLKNLYESVWADMPEIERSSLSRLAVFRGGFNLSIAQKLFQIRADVLAALMDQAWVEKAENGRYYLAEGGRLYAESFLGDSSAKRDPVLDFWARFYLRFIKERERGLAGYKQGAMLSELREEFANVHAAFERALDKAWVREIGMAARGLALYVDMQGLARDWEPLLAKALRLWPQDANVPVTGLSWEESAAAHAALMAAQANCLFNLGRAVEGRELMEKSIGTCKQAGDRVGTAYALTRLAIMLGPEDDRRRAALEEAMAQAQAGGDANGVAWAQRVLGYQLCLQGRAKEGRPMVEASLKVFRELGNQRECAWCLRVMGQLDSEIGLVEQGSQGLAEARKLFEELGDLENTAWTLNSVGRLALRRRQWAEARAAFEDCLHLFARMRHFKGRTLILRALCELFAAQGDMASAFNVVDRAILEAESKQDAAGHANSLIQKAHLLNSQGKGDEALNWLGTAQEIFTKIGSALGQGLALEAQAAVRAGQGRGEIAKALLDHALKTYLNAGIRDGEARAAVRRGDLEPGELGEEYYQRALRLSRQHRPGDYSIGALLGRCQIMLKQGRKLEALTQALICEKTMEEGLMPASEPDYQKELAEKFRATMSMVSAKLLSSVVEDQRARLAETDMRAMFKACIEQNI